MKNPFNQIYQCIGVWNSLRRYPNLFSLSDAVKQFHRVILPGRLNDKLAGRGFNHDLRLHTESKIPLKSVKIECVPLDLEFYWNGPLDNNLYFMAEQEFNLNNPHCYTTPPINLDSTRHVIDVGACEGLFAFRMAKMNRKIHVHCFEPGETNAQLISEGAIINQVSDSISVHSEALLDQPGYVKFQDSDSPDAGIVVPCKMDEPGSIRSNSLDVFCTEKNIQLSRHDLIKIDAEGSDFEVLKGARKMIEIYQPQIAVTTYHKDDHAEAIYRWLNDMDLGYSFRLKGFSFWTSKPRPVLLQASTLH